MALINEQERIANLLEVVRRELADLADRVGDAARHSDVQRAEARRAVREATWILDHDPRRNEIML